MTFIYMYDKIDIINILKLMSNVLCVPCDMWDVGEQYQIISSTTINEVKSERCWILCPRVRYARNSLSCRVILEAIALE